MVHDVIADTSHHGSSYCTQSSVSGYNQISMQLIRDMNNRMACVAIGFPYFAFDLSKKETWKCIKMYVIAAQHAFHLF